MNLGHRKKQGVRPPKRLGRRQNSGSAEHVHISTGELVSVLPFRDDCSLPCVISPNLREVDLPSWAKDNREFLEQTLLSHGAVLFRGFNLKTSEDFQRYLDEISVELMNYTEGATPRTRLAKSVYTSTEFPSQQRIAPHNELSYVVSWPERIWFFCEVPADSGGETPIVDVRKVCTRLNPQLRSQFERKQWMLTRNYLDGFGLDWRDVFHTTEQAEVEDYCHSSNIEFEWVTPDHLRTRQVRPATRAHPVTGDELWFNHVAFWHESTLEPEFRKMYLDDYGEENLPYNTYYGDGVTIDREVIEEIQAAYQAETVKFPWMPGDLLMLDNMRVAHAREPFSGERRILAAMGQPFSPESAP